MLCSSLRVGIRWARLTKSRSSDDPSQPPLDQTASSAQSFNQTPKTQLDLERHGGRKPAGVCVRILQRLLALSAAIWHNETTNRPGPARSLLAYDH